MTATISQLPDHAVVDARPGDQAAATEVEEWLQAYATSRDPQLRERIILAYLSLADRLASRLRHSHGTSPEDLIQTARAGLIAAIDRYDPNYGNPFVPYAVACVVGETSATCVTPAGGLGVAEEEVLEALAVAQSRQELSLDRPIGDDTARCLSDLVAAPSPRRNQKISWPSLS